MATTRKRTSGFSEKPKEESTEQEEIEQMLDVLAQDTFEEISKKEELVVTFIPQEIVPTEDVGPRFVEETPAPPTPVVQQSAQKLQPPPKRHPRNIPKFSRYK